MPRFVILLHEMPPESARSTHWDLMLETGNLLRSWALSEPPPEICNTDDTSRITQGHAEALPDHRLAYLDYEGEVSGRRGRVTRWDAGTYELCPAPQAAAEPPPATKRDLQETLSIAISGQRFRGQVVLTPEDGRYWSISWKGS